MKTIILSALLVLALAANSFSVEKNGIVNKETINSYVAQNNFRAKYKDAQDVVWSEVDGFLKASFVLEGAKKTAFFDASGKYLATSDYLTSESLPAAAAEKVKRYYKNYKVAEVLRYEKDATDTELLAGSDATTTFYFVSLRSAKKHIAVKVSPDNEITFFQTL